MSISSSDRNTGNSRIVKNHKEIHTYESSLPLYCLDWSVYPSYSFRMAVSSCIESTQNQIEVLTLLPEFRTFVIQWRIITTYPTSKLMFIPDTIGIYPDLLATCGDYLRIFRFGCATCTRDCILSNSTNSVCAPLTSLDWNENDRSMIGVSCVDTTCIIWNIETGQAVGQTPVTGRIQAQIIAHEREVLDIAFNPGATVKDLFITSGIDGSIRLFDLRHLEHSTIIFETADKSPLSRVKWNRCDSNILASFSLNSSEVFTVDIRMPCKVLACLKSHTDCINGISWAPHSSFHLCTVADDCQVLIWDLKNMTGVIEDPILNYHAKSQINNVQWSRSQPEWIAIVQEKTLELLRV